LCDAPKLGVTLHSLADITFTSTSRFLSPIRDILLKVISHYKIESASTMASPGAIYTPLDASNRQIRLLRVEPASEEAAPIVCTLEIASLDDNLDFTALSYVWGDATITEDITLSAIEPRAQTPRWGRSKMHQRQRGALFPVTVNLAAALRQLRKMRNDYT
jgi:hypothetical protein